MFLLHFKYMQFVIADQSIDAWLYFCEMSDFLSVEDHIDEKDSCTIKLGSSWYGNLFNIVTGSLLQQNAYL